MSKETPTLVAKKRDRLGTRYARRLRAAGELPANLFGHGTAPMPISLNEHEATYALKRGAHVLSLKFEDGQTDTVLVKDLQFGFLGDNVIHMDLARVNLDETVTVKVHLSFVGTPEAIVCRIEVMKEEEAAAEAAAPEAKAAPEVLTAKKEEGAEASKDKK